MPAYWEGDIPWVTGADLGPDGQITPRSHITPAGATSVVPAGTVLLVTRTSVGKVAVAPFELAFSQDITAIEVDPQRIDTDYLVHFLRTCSVALAGQARGATIKGVTREVVASLDLPLPPLGEQRRIAKILDQADALLTKRRQSLALLHQLTQSVFRETIATSPATPQEARPLRAMSDVITKGTTPTSVGMGFSESGIPFLRVQDLVDGEVRRRADSLFVSEETHESLRRSRILPGDLLVSIAGTVGRTALVSLDAPEMNCNQAIAIVRLTDPLDRQYVHAWLSTADAKRQIAGSAVTATISNLSLAELGNLRIPDIEREIKQRFAEAIAALEGQRNRVANDLERHVRLRESLKLSAFTGSL